MPVEAPATPGLTTGSSSCCSSPLAITTAVGYTADAVIIGLVIVVNTAIGVAQEVRADRAVDALDRLAAPSARVCRDGADVVIPAVEVVRGDLVRLQPGDVVPADPGEPHNPVLPVAVAVPAVLQVAPVYVAPLGSLLGTTALSAVQLATGVALAAVPALAIVAVRGMGSKNTAGR